MRCAFVTSKYLVPVLQRVDAVPPSAAVEICVVGIGAVPHLRYTCAVERWRVGRKCPVMLVDTNLVARHVTDIERVLLSELTVGRQRLVEDGARFGGPTIARAEHEKSGADD